jgi:glucans biosynthesis protein C
MPNQALNRVNYLDNLRVITVGFVLFVHSLLPYATPNFYPYFIKSHHTSLVYNHMIETLHLISMPIFYFIAGFFSCQMVEKRGYFAFLKNRFHRLGLPLIIGLCCYLPLHCLSYFYYFLSTHLNDLTMLTFHTACIAVLKDPLFYQTLTNPEYFWFLYYLLLFCCCAYLTQQLPLRLKQRIQSYFTMNNTIFMSFFLILLINQLSLKTAIEIPNSLVILPQVFMTYLIFYLLGWVFYQEPAYSILLLKQGFKIILITLIAMVGYNIFLYQYAQSASKTLLILINLFLSLGVFFSPLSILFLTKKYMNIPISLCQYLSKRSFWIYLIGLPCQLPVQYWMSEKALPIILQIIFITLSPIIIGVLTYPLMKGIIYEKTAQIPVRI